MKNPLRPIGRYLLRVALGVDQLGNTLLGGQEDETISSRLGRMELRHGGEISWKKPISKLVAAMLERVDSNHCRDAIEQEFLSDGEFDLMLEELRRRRDDENYEGFSQIEWAFMKQRINKELRKK